MPGSAKFIAITSFLCGVTLMADAPNWKDLMTAAQACLEAGENDRALRMLESAKRQESLHEPDQFLAVSLT